MARNQRHYDPEYKAQAVKLAQEMGSCKKAANELGISPNTLFGWLKAVKEGCLDVGTGAHTPDNALTLNEELITLRKKKLIVSKKRMPFLKKQALFSQRAV
jgi:transposase